MPDSGQATAHPILACAQTIGSALGAVAGIEPLYMSPEDKAALLSLQQDLDRLAELQLRILAVRGRRGNGRIARPRRLAGPPRQPRPR